VIALDTNILVYAEMRAASVEDTNKSMLAQKIIARLDVEPVVPLQVLGEFYTVIVNRYRLSRAAAREHVQKWRAFGHTPATNDTAFDTALDLSALHNLPFYDALILSVASEARCTILLSEDFQHGFSWGGVKVLSPFLSQPDQLIANLLV
jgi:predicted nucleic acid-binding protein